MITIIILTLFVFLILNIIHHITVINQLKAVKQNQFDLIECLGDIDYDMITLNDELKDIKQSINNIAYTNRNQ